MTTEKIDFDELETLVSLHKSLSADMGQRQPDGSYHYGNRESEKARDAIAQLIVRAATPIGTITAPAAPPLEF
jgi:hypothetical protein